jgi:transposase
MAILSLFVGLDYHDDSIQVCVMNSQGVELVNRSVPNDIEAVGELIWNYGSPQSVAIEACCGAADFIEELGERYNWSVRMAHPGYVSRLKQSPDKSDYNDAGLLADLLRVNYLPEVWLAPSETRQLRRLARYRQGLAEDRKRLKLRIRALLREERLKCAGQGKPWTKLWMKWVREDAELGAQADGVCDAGRDRQLPPLPQRQTTRAVLQRHTAERLQRKETSRRRPGSAGQSRTATGSC